MAILDVTLCPICQHPLETLNTRHAGLLHNTFFLIGECCYCDAQFAAPRQVSRQLYDHIYAHAAELPGYARYQFYRNKIVESADALRFLADKEPMYWFVADCLERKDPTRKWRILEVGSGLGYLTYALSQAGWRVQGIDISAGAVSEAQDRFGALFRNIDALELAAQEPGTFDAVVMTEVIEHLGDLYPLLRAAEALLKPGGVALITTPNKSYHPPEAYWRTDAPPVHLSWFSEKAMERLSARCGMPVVFWDFTCFNLEIPRPMPVDRVRPTSHSFDADGTVSPQLRSAAEAVLTHGDHRRALSDVARARRRNVRRLRELGRTLLRPLAKAVSQGFGLYQRPAPGPGVFKVRGAGGDVWRSSVIGAVFEKQSTA